MHSPELQFTSTFYLSDLVFHFGVSNLQERAASQLLWHLSFRLCHSGVQSYGVWGRGSE